MRIFAGNLSTIQWSMKTRGPFMVTRISMYRPQSHILCLSEEIFSLTMKRVLWKHEWNESETYRIRLVVLRSSRGYKRKHHLLLVYYFDPFSSLPGSFRHSIFNYFYLAFSLCSISSITSIWNTTRTFDHCRRKLCDTDFLLFQIWIRFEPW